MTELLPASCQCTPNANEVFIVLTGLHIPSDCKVELLWSVVFGASLDLLQQASSDVVLVWRVHERLAEEIDDLTAGQFELTEDGLVDYCLWARLIARVIAVVGFDKAKSEVHVVFHVRDSVLAE